MTEFQTSKEMIAALTNSLDLTLKRLKQFAESVARQYGYISNGKISTGGMSILEDAFEILGWGDPCAAPADMICDTEGCLNEATCGWPEWNEGNESRDGNESVRYRHTCGKCMRDGESK